MRWWCSRVLLVLMVMGLAFRIALSIHGGLATPPVPGSDASEYDSYAWNLAQGHGYSGISPDVKKPDGQLLEHPTAYRSPGTSVLWAGMYWSFGHRYSVVRIFNCILDTLTILVIYLIGGKCFSDKVALLAAAIYTIWPTALLYSSQLGSETLFTFLFCCFILISLEFAERASWPRAIAAGVLLGLAMLTRGNAVLMVALMVPWSVWQFWRTPRLVVRGVAISLVALVMLVPWTIRNYEIFHAFIPFQTGGGDVLLGSYNSVVASDPLYYGYNVWPTLGFFPTAIYFLRTNNPGWIIHLGVFHFVLTSLIFFGCSRYRYPVEGLCIILASATLVWLCEYISRRFSATAPTRAAPARTNDIQ